MTQFEYQLQMGLILLIAVMAALTWRAHRQISKLSGMSREMRESMQKLEHTTAVVSKIATARPISEEVAMAIEVRRISEDRSDSTHGAR